MLKTMCFSDDRKDKILWKSLITTKQVCWVESQDIFIFTSNNERFLNSFVKLFIHFSNLIYVLSNNILRSHQSSLLSTNDGAMSPVRVGPAVCFVLSPVPLCLTPSVLSLFSSAKNTIGWFEFFFFFCAHPLRKNASKAWQHALLPSSEREAVPSAVTGERGEKQLFLLCSASATTVIWWNKLGMQKHVWTQGLATLRLNHAIALLAFTMHLSSLWWTERCIKWISFCHHTLIFCMGCQHAFSFKISKKKKVKNTQFISPAIQYYIHSSKKLLIFTVHFKFL